MLIRLVCLLALSSLCLSSPLGEFGKEWKEGRDVDKIHEALKRESEEVEEQFAGKEREELLAELRAAYDTSHGTNEVETELEINQNLSKDLYQGDIVLTPEQWARVLDRDRDTTRLRLQALTDVTKLWTPMGEPIIPFSFADGFPTEKENIVTDSLDFWANRTCVKFRPARKTDKNFIEFNHNTSECSSRLGMVGGKQTFNLAPRCLSVTVITHELSHAFGTEHIHTRSDRDDYIILDTDNIWEDAEPAFEKDTPDLLMGNYSIPYEFGSLMHYQNNAAAIIRGRPTISARRPYSKYQRSMGSPLASFYDVRLINKMYKCTDKCKNQISCENNGVQDANDCNQCFCPKGWAGARCEKRPDSAYLVKLSGNKQITMVVPAVRGEYAEKLYAIEAPIDKRIKATVTWIENHRYLPCDLGRFFEIIPTKDTRINGIRMCDNPGQAPIESDSNQMLVRMYNTKRTRLMIEMKLTLV